MRGLILGMNHSGGGVSGKKGACSSIRRGIVVRGVRTLVGWLVNSEYVRVDKNRRSEGSTLASGRWAGGNPVVPELEETPAPGEGAKNHFAQGGKLGYVW